MRVLLCLMMAGLCSGQQWSKPVEVIAADEICATYDAHLAANVLTVRLRLAKGWHSFAMDNTIRANEKLAGKKALSFDRPTSVAASGGWEIAGPWKQSAVKDFSKPELRVFSWGFEEEALFQVPMKASSGGAAHLEIKAQACTETICRNIDVKLDVAASAGPAAPATGLQEVRANGST